MQYTRTLENGQLVFSKSDKNLLIPSQLYNFENSNTDIKTTVSGKPVFCFYGEMELDETDLVCPVCGKKHHVHAHPEITLSHLPIGSSPSKVIVTSNRFKCPHCGNTKNQYLSFKADKHRITRELETFIKDLLALGCFTNKAIANLTGVNAHIIKDIDKRRLQEKYTVDGKTFKKPEQTARIIGIDEFKLHSHYKYATVILDMRTGHVLWLDYGKGKQVVYNFINHVGMDWMEKVEAVSCDMNANYYKAFEEVCEWIQPVFDHFHLIKNFNEKVINEVRKDEQRRLREEGDFEAAAALKKTRYILTSKRQTLIQKDKKAGVNSDSSNPDKASKVAKYNALIEDNRLLFTIDLIKDKLDLAYKMTNEPAMAKIIEEIMDLCQATGNKHFLWFRNLLDKHFEGIIAHATFRISNAKVEGFNNRVKTSRRQAFGYHDDEYFFLKLFDLSWQEYVKNPKSHRIIQ